MNKNSMNLIINTSK